MTLNMHARLTADGKQAQAELTKTAKAAGHLVDEVQDIGAKAPVANRATSALAGGGLKQIGMQLSQVAQQGAATGNYFQALTIQAADIGLAFGGIGIAVGTALTFLGPFIGNLIAGGDAASDAADKMDLLADAMARMQRAQSDAARGGIDLSDAYGEMAARARQLFDIERQIAEIRAREAQRTATRSVAQELGIGGVLGLEGDDIRFAEATMKALRTEIDRLNSSGTQVSDEALRSLNNRIVELQDKADALRSVVRNFDDLAGALGITEGEAREVAARFAEIEALEGAQAQADAMIALAAYINDVSGNLGEAEEEGQALYDQLLEAVRAALDLAATDIASPIRAGASEAERLANWLGIAVSSALQLSALTPAMADEDALMGQQVIPDAGMRERQRQAVENYNRLTAPPKTPGRSGGAGGAAREERDVVADLIEKKREELDLLRETDPVQQEMIRLRGELAGATADQRADVEALIATYFEEQRAQEQLAETSEFFRSSMADLIPGLVRGGDEAASSWQRFVRVLEDAAWQALLLGEGPLMSLFGGGGGGGLIGIFASLLGFADGGMHYGQGGPRADKELVRVSPGEFTVNAKATQQHRALLEAINAGAPIPGFAAGGIHGGGAPILQPTVITQQFINETGANLRMSREERTQPDGSRLERFVIAEAVAEGLTTRGGAGRRTLQQTFGVQPRRLMR